MSKDGKLILSALLIVGAQSRDQAEPLDRLAVRIGIGSDSLARDLVDLQEKGYVVLYEKEGMMGAYLTSTGIVTASSTYS
ncbi:MAG TPA: hypothetical protein VMS77_10320 [Conexivisphaerales archaeon]|nr:hypothetical protein [Conexivisphaerales archaeon]